MRIEDHYRKEAYDYYLSALERVSFEEPSGDKKTVVAGMIILFVLISLGILYWSYLSSFAVERTLRQEGVTRTTCKHE